VRYNANREVKWTIHHDKELGTGEQLKFNKNQTQGRTERIEKNAVGRITRKNGKPKEMHSA
jgi:hypothetical protein